MKRTITYISTALLLIAGLCISCQKEQSPSEEKGASVNEVIVKATIGGADTKVSFTEDGSTLKTAWENDDHIVGWDANGNAIELEIASIDNGTAIFKTVEGSEAIPTSGKVYMIYAPGKNKSNISNRSLEYSLADQGSGKVPALMTATGEVSNNVLTLTFTNQLAILAVKNPTFPVTEATTITGLKLSGSNIQTKATFSMDGEALKMESSVAGEIKRACDFTTVADGKTETMVYFAVLPNGTAAEVTVSTTAPEGYQISFPGKSFAAGDCYMLSENNINKQQFTVTVAEGITGGTISTNPSGSVAWDTEVTITASPSEGYELATLTYNDGSDHDIKEIQSFTMPKEDVTVSGSFQKIDYAIAVNGTGTGAYTVEGGTYTVENSSGTAVTAAKMGDVITVTPSSNTGYSVGTVTVKKTDTEESVDFDSSSKTFTMPAAGVTITVTFTHDTYAINDAVTPESSGTVTFKKSGSDDGITQAFYGDEITVVDAPADGYELESIKWKEEGGTDDDITSTKKFTMPAKAVTVTVTFKELLTGTISGHNYVKIGSKKWATTNLGATTPQDYGNLYSWGNPSGSNGDNIASPGFTKDNYDSPGKDISSDSGWTKATHDAAYNDSNWGHDWHMPTKEDFVDLAANGVWYWTNDYNGTGKSGYIVYVANDKDDKGKAFFNGTLMTWNGSSYDTESVALKGTYSVNNDTHIFFPAAGYSINDSRTLSASYGYYWSSSWNSTDFAHVLYFRINEVGPQNTDVRYHGCSVRPVSD